MTWTAALLLLALGTDVARLVRSALPRPPDVRAGLPNYPDHQLARQIYADHNQARRRYVPIVESRHEPVVTQTTNIGRDGFRIHHAGRNDGPDTVAIGFFGGSAMWGTGADDDHTIPGAFDQLTTRYAVRNYAELGWVSRQSLAQLVNLIVEGRAPEITVFYDGFNDVTTLCNVAGISGVNGTALEERIRTWIHQGKQQGEVGLYRVFVLPFVEAVESLRPTRWHNQYECDRDAARAERVATTLVSNWTLAARLMEGERGRFHGFLQPSIHTGTPRTEHLPSVEMERWGDQAILRRQFDAVYPRVREKLTHSALDWADLTNALDGEGYFYVDPAHLSPNGNDVVARRMLEHLGGEPSASRHAVP